MANCVREIKYRCQDDCKISGCPGHDGKLEFQSVSEHYHFTMNGKEMHFEAGELQAMIDLIRLLNRVDTVKLERQP